MSAEVAAAVTIPAKCLDDARSAIVENIAEDGDKLRRSAASDYEEDRESSLAILVRDMRVLEQLTGTTADVTVEAVEDGVSHISLRKWCECCPAAWRPSAGTDNSRWATFSTSSSVCAGRRSRQSGFARMSAIGRKGARDAPRDEQGRQEGRPYLHPAFSSL
jgi:hypothetical protein